MKTKQFILICFKAVACFLAVVWTISLSEGERVWMETVAFFFLAMFECTNKKNVLPKVVIVGALIIGRILLEAPVRIVYWSDTLGTLVFTIVCIVAILLGWTASYKGHNPIRFVVCFLLLYILNIGAIHWFMPLIDSLRHIQ